MIEDYVYMNWNEYLCNKIAAFLSEDWVIMMPLLFEEAYVWKPVFHFSLEPPSLAERNTFKTTWRYWRWLWMSYLKHQRLQITITWHGFAGSPCRSYPVQIFPIFSVWWCLHSVNVHHRLYLYPHEHGAEWILAQANSLIVPDTVCIYNVSW